MESKDKLILQTIKMLERNGLQFDKKLIKRELQGILQKYTVESNHIYKQNAIETMISDFVSVRRIDGLSGGTLRNYRERLRLFSRFITKPVNKITTDDIRSYITYLTDERKLKRSTLATDINILKNFFNWLLVEGKIKANPCMKIKGLKIDKKGLRKALTVEDVERLRNACQTLREKAIIEVLYSTGCRLSEVVNINLDDINFVERSITVIGKGSKRRTVYFSVKAKIILEDYLKESQRSDNSLFTGKIKPYKRISGRALQQIVKRLGTKAGLNKKVHPHLLRHSLACHALNSGMDIIVIQKLLGHEDVGTTQIYAEINESSVQQAYRRLID